MEHSIHCYVHAADKSVMARRGRPSITIGRRAYEVMLLSAGPESEFGIVDTTMLNGLLSLVPDSILTQFIENQSRRAPAFDDPRFSGWVRACRSAIGLTQKEFASQLNLTGVKLHDSDIGNLENGLRKSSYSLSRRQEITEAIQSLINSHHAKSGSPSAR